MGADTDRMEIRPDPACPALPAAPIDTGITGQHRLRSIRWQIVAAIAGVSLAVSALLLPVAHRQIESSFRDFEIAYARHEAHRLQVLLAEEANSLKRTALDYTRWDEAVGFIAAPTTAWVEENLAEDVLENFNAELILVADAGMKVLTVRAAAHTRANSAAPAVDAPLCRAAITTREPVHRFAMLHGSAHLLVCSPIYSPAAPTVVPGVMLWAVELSGARMAKMRDLSRLDFALQPAAGPLEDTVHVEAGAMRLTAPVRDSDGHVALQADIRMPRPLGEQRALATSILYALLAAALTVPPLLALLLLDVLVVRRIRRMSAWVRELRVAGPAQLPQRLASMTDKRAGFYELQRLGSDVASLASHLETLRADWQRQALRDALTGLPNRACLIADVERHFAGQSSQIALLVIDLDGFKAVNDMLGHDTGDELLMEASQRFASLLPAHACAYRLGGDEFAVVAIPSAQEDAEAIAERIAAHLRFVRHAAGRPLVVSASTGVALSSEDRSTHSASVLLTEADAAMYDAKRIGPGVWRRTSPGTRSKQREQIEVASALRAAMQAGRLHAWFQPIVDARGGRLLAVEALARWNEPGWGDVPPARFIPVAERSGQIFELDLAILASSLAAFVRLQALHPHVRLHANVSAQSLADPEYVGRFMALLALHALKPGAVVLELTESDIAVEHVQLEAALGHLRSVGVGLSVDDFGVGTSSLARLAVLKPDCIKIDGSFVRDLDRGGGPICRVVIELARELGLSCIAEYVETDAQADVLARMGCHALQGYGPGMPQPTLDFVARYACASPQS